MPKGRVVLPPHIGDSLWKQSATAIVYQQVIGGVLNTIAISGYTGRVIAQGTVPETVVNTAFTTLGAGARIILLDYNFTLSAAGFSFSANSQVLEGQGRGTFIDGDALATGVHAINLSGFTDCEIRNLSVQTEDGGGKTCYPIFIEDGSDRFRVENVWIVDSDADGIHVEGTTIDTGHIVGCHILGADGAGINVAMDAANFAYRLHIEGNDIGNCGAEGILFTATTGGNHYCEIVNNNVHNPGTDSIKVYDSDHVLIQGNICIGSGDEGIDVRDSNHANITGNTATGNTANGILIGFGAPCTGCTITGNTCNGNGEAGIVLVTNCDDNTVSGNTCNGNTNHGIFLQGVDGSTVSGNTCNGNIRHGIYLYGSSDNTLSGNTCHRNDSGNTGTYDGIYLDISSRNIISENNCQENDRWGIMVDTLSDYNKISMNYTNVNGSGSIRINNANSDRNQIEFNTVEEGAPSDAGTLTRSYGNYDPSANAFVGDVGAAPF